MSATWMRPLLGLVVLTAAALLGAPTASASCADEDLRPDTENLKRVKSALICLHNQERHASGVPRLRSNSLLELSADGHSADMTARRYFAHENPDGLDPFERMERADYILKGLVWNAGENIAWGSGTLSTARSIFDAWMKSPGHRLTLLASDFSEIGIGIALGAPSEEHQHRTDAVTYTADFGWRETPTPRRPSACLRRASRAPSAKVRRSARARCRRPLRAQTTSRSIE